MTAHDLMIDMLNNACGALDVPSGEPNVYYIETNCIRYAITALPTERDANGLPTSWDILNVATEAY